MAAKGALGTSFAISPAKPAALTEGSYEALDTRTINPSAVTIGSDEFTIPAADYAAVITGEPVTVTDDGNVTGINANDRLYAIKGSTVNRLALATTRANAIAGAKIDLGGSLGSAELEISNYKECLESTNVGEYGREYNVVRVVNLADGATRKFKGSYDNGTVQVEDALRPQRSRSDAPGGRRDGDGDLCVPGQVPGRRLGRGLLLPGTRDDAQARSRGSRRRHHAPRHGRNRLPKHSGRNVAVRLIVGRADA